MLIVLLVASVLFSTANTLKCQHNASGTHEEYVQEILVSMTSFGYDMGVLDCAANLDRCVNFKLMDIALYRTLDAGRDNSAFSNQIEDIDGKVAGSCCMSQADVDKIKATKADICTGDADKSCYCTTDKCTGAAGSTFTLLTLSAVLIYSITVQ